MAHDYIWQNQSMMRIIETSIRENWNYLAYDDFGTDIHFTYGEAAREFARLHEVFETIGLKRGQRIAVCDRSTSRWAIAYLAAFTYGAVVVPILQDFSGEQIWNILVHSETSLLICGIGIKKKLEAASNSPLPCRTLDIQEIGTEAYDMPFAKADVHYFDDQMDDMAMLSYTSGSTGRSKGVMLPYRAIWSNTAFAEEKLNVPMHSRFLSLLPLAHMYGFAFEFMYAFCIGGHVTFLAKTPSPSVLVQAMGTVRPYVVIAVPLVIEKIVRGKIFPALRAMRMRTLLTLPIVRNLVYRKIRKRLISVFGGEIYEIIIGGAAFSSEVEDFLKRIRFPYTVGYGMTECAPIISYRDWKSFRKGSCGQPVPRMEVRILSNDPLHEAGEIVTRGMNVMLGYYKDEEATVATIDKDGWLHTGDLGTLDVDQNLYIRGRSKNMLLGANGQNIYPEEIEEKLTSHTLIDECVVVQRGEKLVGLVYVSDDTLHRHGMSRKEWRENLDRYRNHVNKMLPAFDALSQLEPREEEFEKTPKRNIRRFLYK